jgi:hypothetical protein
MNVHRDRDKWMDRMKLSNKKGFKDPGSLVFIVTSISFTFKDFFEGAVFLRLSKESAIAII